MNFKYLQPKQFYIDQYDLHTIRECLDWFFRLKNGMEEHREKLKKTNPEIDFDHEVLKVCSYTVNALKGVRYRNKNERIQQWMDRDQRLQDIQDKTLPPKDIVCHLCRSDTVVIDKTLHGSLDEGTARMSFMFECLKCKKRQIFYDDGSPWDYQPEKCKTCDVPLKTKYKADKKKDTLTTTTFCPNCSYKRIQISDFKKDRKERKLKEEKDRAILQEYRKEFCLDDTNGPKYIQTMDRMRDLVDSWKKQEQKEKDPVYQKAKNLKKLKLNQLKELLVKIIEKEGYADLEFGKPDMSSHVVVDFTVNDTKDDRQEYGSRKRLKKLVDSALLDTNWRLMSGGVSYRLGILSGRLKAYEQEEDLIKIVKNNT